MGGMGLIGLIGLIGQIGLMGLMGQIGLMGLMGLMGQIGFISPIAHQSQSYVLTCRHDSLYYLNEWRLPYPVYRFDVGDVDGDGHEDALVGVVKSTRFYPQKDRRLFIFKQVKGRVRPLWLGSKLGGKLIDFRFIDGRIRSLESYSLNLYSVAEWKWKGFGLQFQRYLVENTSRQKAEKVMCRK